ncbi:MAG: hypothetical protein DRP06_00060 [Candidatus Aenigmatarchaeota archaeon]|nr:MAG: hypothetical protein DRP06_00060 [Candidatus Aenigmarchaeota archaeon]
MRKKLFRNREQRKKFIMVFFAVLVGGVFLLEIIAIPLMYKEPETNIKSPEELAEKFKTQWIFEENLTEQEKQFMIQKGVTIATYYYASESGFFELEDLVKSLEGQVILEKVKSDETKIELESIRDFVIITDFKEETLFKGICDTIYYPPPDCASFGD